MAKISLSPKFIKEVIMLFREKSLKEMLFGKRVILAETERQALEWIDKHPDQFKEMGGRRGLFVKIDPIHKGIGVVCLLPNIIENKHAQTILVFSEDTKITNGPDLWVYLSKNIDIKKDGIGEYLDIGLIKGNKGGQSYMIEKNIAMLGEYKSAVIWCKQFSVLFTFAVLS